MGQRLSKERCFLGDQRRLSAPAEDFPEIVVNGFIVVHDQNPVILFRLGIAGRSVRWGLGWSHDSARK
jgi:hypothetical protein